MNKEIDEEKTQEQIEASFEEWVLTRPEYIRDTLRAYPPYKLYKLKTTNHIIQLYSYNEEIETNEISFTVLVLHKYNMDLNFERKVFGIEKDDLEMIADDGHEYEVINQDIKNLH